jgi:hypothetical protein
MLIHMGIMCERCRKVHFVATSRGVKPSEFSAGMYRLKCSPPCSEGREFRKDSMRPYRISEDVFRRGWADEGEYELVQVPKRPTRQVQT